MEKIIRSAEGDVLEPVILVEEALDPCRQSYAGGEAGSRGRGGGFEDADVVALAFEEDGDEEGGVGSADLVGKGCELRVWGEAEMGLLTMTTLRGILPSMKEWVVVVVFCGRSRGPKEEAMLAQ